MGKMRKVLVWRLHVLLAERKIRTVTELKRRLMDQGFEISTVQLSRIVNDRPQRLNLDLMEAIVNLLNCRIEDIIFVEESPIEEEEGSAVPQVAKLPVELKRVRKPRSIRPGEKDDDVTGPKVSAFPLPDRNKKK